MQYESGSLGTLNPKPLIKKSESLGLNMQLACQGVSSDADVPWPTYSAWVFMFRVADYFSAFSPQHIPCGWDSDACILPTLKAHLRPFSLHLPKLPQEPPQLITSLNPISSVRS